MRCFKLTISSILIAILATALISAGSKSYVKVIHVTGTAEYLKATGTDWKDVRVGISLFSGDSIKTYKDSSVEIAFDGRKKKIIDIKPGTYIVLKLGETEKIELIDGEVFSLVKKLPRGSRFEIRTPTAICGARGTGWGANANKNRTVVSAYENDSYAKGIRKDGSIVEDNLIVKEGYQTTVKRFDKPSKLMRITDRDFERWNSWKDDLIERISARRAIRERLSRDLEKIQGQKEKIEELRDDERIDKRTEETGAGGGQSGCRKEIVVP